MPENALAHTRQAKQGSVFIAKADFCFRATRLVKVRAGSRFWKTNTAEDTAKTGFFLLDREGRGKIGCGYAFTSDMVESLFTPVL